MRCNIFSRPSLREGPERPICHELQQLQQLQQQQQQQLQEEIETTCKCLLFKTKKLILYEITNISNISNINNISSISNIRNVSNIILKT